jgi:Phage XkdN-like protein.
MAAETLSDFLLEDATGELIVEKHFSERFQKAGFKFKIRNLTSEEYNEIQKMCTIQKKKSREFDAAKFNNQIILTACIEPNFRDAELIKKAKVTTPTQLLHKLLRPGEMVAIAEEIITLSGFNQDFNELEEEVKN